MRQTTNLIQLFKDFFILVLEAENLLLEENIKDFLVEFEGIHLQEAEEAFPLNFINLFKETEEYAKELQWYIENHHQSVMNHALSLQKLTFYRKHSLTGLKTIKTDRDSTLFEDRRQNLSNLLNRFINLFNQSLSLAREEIQGTPISKQTNWIELYELSDVNIEDL